MTKEGIQLQNQNGDKKGSSSLSKEATTFPLSYLGRTPLSWVKVILYYIWFYTSVVAFLALNYYLFSKTLSDSSPTWIMNDSIMGSIPGLSIRPRTGASEVGDGNYILISYNVNNNSHADFLAKQLEDALKETQVPLGTQGIIDCSQKSKSTPTTSDVCSIPISNLGNCTIQNKFGYDKDTPCVLVKLNRMYGWIPEPFGLKDGKFISMDTLQADLEQKEEMPQELKSFILKEVQTHKGNEFQALNKVWISCSEDSFEEAAPSVVKMPQGGILYYPSRSISVDYFPFHNQKNYRSPFVMVEFQVPRISRHTIIRIECRAWAKNVHHSGNIIAGLGAVKFGLLLN